TAVCSRACEGHLVPPTPPIPRYVSSVHADCDASQPGIGRLVLRYALERACTATSGPHCVATLQTFAAKRFDAGRRLVKQGPTFGPDEDIDGPDIAPIWDSSVVGVFEVSMDGLVRSANATFADWLGAASTRSLIGRRLTDLTADQREWGDWQAAALAGRERAVTVAFESGRGAVVLRGDLVPKRPRAAGTSVAALSGVFTNVSEEHRLHRAVQRGARMEALGSLTSGIAHDFNNLLTVLVGNLYLVAEELRDQPKSFAKLKSARDAARRGADLIRQLLAFARRE